MQLINDDFLDVICGAGSRTASNWEESNELARLIEEINTRNANRQPPINMKDGW